MVTVISRFRVRNGLEQEVRGAFLDRPRLVEKAAGFCSFDVLTDHADPAIFLLVTRWTDEESFRAWHRSEAHHQSHALIPRGLKLDPSFTSLTIGDNIEDPAGVQNLSDALERRTSAFSPWLMESDAVCALLLAPDGTIRARNRAAHRIFPADPARDAAIPVWDYLVPSDAEHMRQRLSNPAGRCDGCLLLNLAHGQQDPITLEARLIPCSGATLLLAAQEHRLDSSVRTETLALTNELSVMTREAARKNRELEAANATIERLARTDALTGLANRRSLDEALRREIARAARLGESLSVAMADLDDFKSINDRFGHVTGDRMLVRAAAAFGNRLRPYDVAGRFGGDEFLLVLPGASTDGAVAVAERVRKEIADITLPGCPVRMTVSLGVASWTTGETPDEIVSRADAALYKAKKAGRNQVEAAASAPAQKREEGLRN